MAILPSFASCNRN